MDLRLIYRRKLYAFHVETFDPARLDWIYRGQVLLPDRAYRAEIRHALRVFDLDFPRRTDGLSWAYATMPDFDTARRGGGLGPLPWPKALVSAPSGTPLVRLTARMGLPRSVPAARLDEVD